MVADLKSLVFRRFRFQVDLAEAAGVREERLSRIIRGRVQPTADEKLRIAKALEVAPDEIWPTI
jgi:plasmid maintenance system antidote protein VapI